MAGSRSAKRSHPLHPDSTVPVPLTQELHMMRLVWELDHALRFLSRTMENHLGVTGPQRLVLRIIGQRPGVSPGALAEFLHLDSSTLSGHLKQLEALRLVERVTARDDARRTAVHLTAAGRRLDVRTPGTVEAAVEAALADTTASDLAHVERFLVRLAQEVRTQAIATAKTRSR